MLVSGLGDYSHELSCLCFDVLFEFLFPSGAFLHRGGCHILGISLGGQLVQRYRRSVCCFCQVLSARWVALVLLSVVYDVVVQLLPFVVFCVQGFNVSVPCSLPVVGFGVVNVGCLSFVTVGYQGVAGL